MQRWCLVVCLILTTLLVASSSDAFAQEPSDSGDEVARRLFEAGRASFDAGEYEDALKFFEDAYLRSRRPRLLYNIGQAADRLRYDRKAIDSFYSYLAAMPEADNRTEVQNRIRALERRRDSAGVPTPVQTANAAALNEEADSSERTASTDLVITKQWWFWTAIGAGVVAGVVIAVAASSGDSYASAPGGTDGTKVSTLVMQ